MDDKVVQLDAFRQKPEPVGDPMDQPMDKRDQDMFAMDTVADGWANDLVHGLMKEFLGDPGVDPTDPVYAKLMEAMAEVVRTMTRHHLDVFDINGALLKQYPESVMIIDVATSADQEGEFEL